MSTKQATERTAAELMALARVRAVRENLVVEGTHTAYWVYKATTKNPSTALDVVILHGYRGDHNGLEALAGALSDFNVYSPDLPGFGQSSPFAAKRHDLKGYSDWFTAFVRGLKLSRPAFLLGHSYGSSVVASATANGLVASGIVLINPVVDGVLSGSNRFLTGVMMVYYEIAAKLPKRSGLAMLKWKTMVSSMSAVTTKSKDKAIRKWIDEQHQMHFNSFANSDVVLQSYRSSTTTSIARFAKDISVPVFLVPSDRDEVTPQEKVFDIAKEFKNARVYLVPNCGHLVHYEAAEPTMAKVAEFIYSVSGK
jgi:pimeloyl-ACP methyl ester carboxylesterase